MSLPEPLAAEGSQALQAVISSPSETLIATDFDGTLAPIVGDPEEAYADPEAVAALGRLGKLVGAVVVITGRPVGTVVRLGRFRETPGLGSMIVLGQYGVERWNAADDQFLIPPGDLGDLAAFRAVRDLAAAGVTGLLVCSASNEEEALAELSDVIVDGPAGLAAWLNALAAQLEGRA